MKNIKTFANKKEHKFSGRHCWAGKYQYYQVGYFDLDSNSEPYNSLCVNLK